MLDSSLTPKQLTILQLLLDGKYLKQVALELQLTQEDVKVNLFRARQRAGVETLYQLVAVSVLRGWCTPPVSLETAGRPRP